MEMNVPTVYLLGEDHLELIPEYLQLGSVVVVAPDRDILRRWTDDQQDDDPSAPVERSELNGLVVDLSARRVSFDGMPLNLTDLEFRVLAALMNRPGRAWSFTDLRRTGWGVGQDLYTDDQTVRALVQRLRKKLLTARVPIAIEAVRSFGFRAEMRSRGTPAPEGLSITGVSLKTNREERQIEAS
jgi:DNA-binding winged helix-turn-helix (wHTH) protein